MRLFVLLTLTVQLAFPSDLETAIALADEPANTPDTRDVAQMMRDLRTKAAQWVWVKGQLDLVATVSEKPLHWKGEIYWCAPSQMAVFIKSEGEFVSSLAYFWNSESHSEFDAEGGQEKRVNLRALRERFTVQTLQRSGLLMGMDPFRSVEETSVCFVGEESLNGEPTLLFEAKYWPQFTEGDEDAEKALLWISPEDGLLRRLETYEKNGERGISQLVTIVEKKIVLSERCQLPHIEGKYHLYDNTNDAVQWLRKNFGHMDAKHRQWKKVTP